MLLNHWIEDSEDSIYAMVTFLYSKNWTDEKDYGNDAITSFLLWVFFFFYAKNWTDEKDYGNDTITSFANHFWATLVVTRYD